MDKLRNVDSLVGLLKCATAAASGSIQVLHQQALLNLRHPPLEQLTILHGYLNGKWTVLHLFNTKCGV